MSDDLAGLFNLEIDEFSKKSKVCSLPVPLYFYTFCIPNCRTNKHYNCIEKERCHRILLLGEKLKKISKDDFFLTQFKNKIKNLRLYNFFPIESSNHV